MNRGVWLFGTLIVVAAAFAQDAQPSDDTPAPAAKAPVASAAKAPIPDTAALQESRKLANEVYGAETAKAKTPEEKIDLAKKLLQAAIDAQGDAAGRYVLLGMAADVAAQAGDTETTFAATDEVARAYTVDGLKVKAEPLSKLAKAKDTDAAALAERSAGLIDEAIAAERYDVARQVAEQAVALAKKNGGGVQAATARLEDINAIEAGQSQGKKALAILANDPNNTAAFLTLGRFYCFVKGDWEKGVPMLSNSGDKALKAMADKELAKPSEAAKQVEVADGWWDLAEKEKGLSKRRLREHAVEWYKKALPELTSLMKAKVEKRLEESITAEEAASKWMVLFRSDDPSIWNTNTNRGKNRFAVELAKVPTDIHFLRMTCAGKSVIIPISQAELGNYNDLPTNAGVAWTGRRWDQGNGFHLGIYGKGFKMSRGSIAIVVKDYGGWGFGHISGVDTKQGYSWEGKTIERTVFEIAVTSARSLMSVEKKTLLNEAQPTVK